MIDEQNPQFSRFSSRQVKAALEDTPVVMLNGPRQCGKTTLVREFAGKKRTYITLDDDTVLAAARADPTGLVRDLEYVIIDEVQRAPDLLRAIKKSVDDDRRPGRFLLTGSANVLTLPQVSESLAGRMAVINLLPLAQAEIRGHEPSFLKQAFAGKLVKPPAPVLGADLIRTVLAGGYPEMRQRTDLKRSQAWARDYVNAIVKRDVRDIASIEKLAQLPRLLRVLAQHSGQLTNFTQIGGQLQLDAKTVEKYLTVFEQLFLLRRIEPWFHNRLKRMVKSPKLHFLDAGLLAALAGITGERIAKDRSLFGHLLETFVFSEILKHTTWHEQTCLLLHYRDRDQNEVDVVIEDEAGALIGVEVKAAASVNTSDFKGLRKMAEASGDAFKLGVVFYDGDIAVPFGNGLFAAPLSCLWG
jgi:uncharacterized protein